MPFGLGNLSMIVFTSRHRFHDILWQNEWSIVTVVVIKVQFLEKSGSTLGDILYCTLYSSLYLSCLGLIFFFSLFNFYDFLHLALSMKNRFLIHWKLSLFPWYGSWQSARVSMRCAIHSTLECWLSMYGCNKPQTLVSWQPSLHNIHMLTAKSAHNPYINWQVRTYSIYQLQVRT